MKNPFSYLSTLWIKNGTKILGYVGGAQTLITGAMAIDGLIPRNHFKYYLLVNLVINVMTLKRGHTNTAVIKEELRKEGG